MTTTPGEPVSDEDIETTGSGHGPQDSADADGSDGTDASHDADGTDSHGPQDSADADASDGTDAPTGDADGTDS
jgi:hypothetical protein